MSEVHPIRGSGDVAELVRGTDWTTKGLAPLAEWPQSLIAKLNMVLAAPFPMQLYWGPEMLAFYNDALAVSLPGKHPHILGTPGRDAYREAWPLVGQQLKDVMDRGSAFSFHNVSIPLSRGEAVEDTYWDYSYSPIFEADGTVAGVLNLAREVTDVVKARQARDASEEQRDLAMDAAELGMWWYDSDTGVVVADERKRRIGGSGPNGSVNDWLALLHPEDIQRVGEHFQAALESRAPYGLEYRIVRADGTRWVRSRGRLVVGPDDRRRMFALVEDITALKLVEESLQRSQTALIQSEKLAAVGRLASSISHEINNPLEAVTNLIYLIRESGTLADVRQYAQIAERELRRVSIITTQTLRFHKQSSKPVAVSCSDLIGETLSVYHGRLVNSRVRVEKRKRALRPVRCMDGEIRQVLSNLIANAIDSMPFGGRLLIRSREATNWQTGHSGLVLTVADTGMGMSPSTKMQIFEPFFSTKGIGGTGLGLWVSREIVSRHSGALRIRSSQKEGASGTVFALFLPFESQVTV